MYFHCILPAGGCMEYPFAGLDEAQSLTIPRECVSSHKSGCVVGSSPKPRRSIEVDEKLNVPSLPSVVNARLPPLTLEERSGLTTVNSAMFE